MKKYLILFIALAFIACSDDDVNPDEYTFQSVLDFDNGVFPNKIGDTVQYNGIVIMNPIDDNYDASYNKQGTMRINMQYFDSKLEYQIYINFNDEVYDGFAASIKKGIDEIDGENMDVIQAINSSGGVTHILSNYKFVKSYGETGIDKKYKYFIFKENKIKL